MDEVVEQPESENDNAIDHLKVVSIIGTLSQIFFDSDFGYHTEWYTLSKPVNTMKISISVNNYYMKYWSRCIMCKNNLVCFSSHTMA